MADYFSAQQPPTPVDGGLAQQNDWLDYLKSASQFGAGGTQGKAAGAGGGFQSADSGPNSAGQSLAANYLGKMMSGGGAASAGGLSSL